MNSLPIAIENFQKKLVKLWPPFKGSLARVYKPCIRPHCLSCAKGDKHSAYIFGYTQNGKRRCMYVPARLVPLFKRGLKNGRQLEQWFYKLGPLVLDEYRQKIANSKTNQKTPPKKHLARSTKLRKMKAKC